MNDLALIISCMLIGAALMLVLLGLALAFIMPGIDKWSRQFFLTDFIFIALYVGFVTAETILCQFPGMKFALEVIYYLETFSASVLLPMITFFLLHCCGESWRSSHLFHAMAVLYVLFFITMNLVPINGLFYFMTPDYQFYRGPLYPLLLIQLEAMQILNLAAVIRRSSRLSKRYYQSFLVAIIPMTLAIFIHLFVSVFIFFGVGIAISGLSMFAIIISDQIDNYLRQQREIAHQNASIMVLQMRPHFIYNTMMSIYYLCKQDPDLAQKVTLDFTNYLRRNFTAITSEELIPFTDELEHTRAYLSVEQAQFEDSLFVEYDTEQVDFLLPPLTLQPIVENAVKHGMDPDSDPLHIIIRTRTTNSANEIIVENTGIDYKPSTDSEPHIALKNIQKRLEITCHGRMLIVPRKDGGTVVKVTIPK